LTADLSYSQISAEIVSKLNDRGLILRGAFHVDAKDNVPALKDGRAVRTLILIGNARPAMWRAFSGARDTDEFDNTGADPLNDWSAEIISEFAKTIGATPYFPFTGPAFLPFQTWALRADTVHKSPLGILIHPKYGLWHAYRGALGFAERLDIPGPLANASPCDTCADKPCLSSCPVNAFDGEEYDVPACLTHVQSTAGADCVEEGCRARRACPVGEPYHADQARFHMEAFIRASIASIASKWQRRRRR
jgi:hypothetical protein